MARFNRIGVLLGGLSLGLLGTTLPAAAQCHGGHSGGHSHGGHGGHSGGHGSGYGANSSPMPTEETSRWSIRAGGLMALAGKQPLSGGVMLESTYFVGTHLQVGGWWAIAPSMATTTNFGYEATRPILGFDSEGLDLRYMLRNNRRWRLDVIGGPGLSSYALYDQDKQVTTSCGCTTLTSIAVSNHTIIDAGLGLTYKLWRQLWLTSDLRYNYLLGNAAFGAADLKSRWQLSVALTLPSGFVRDQASK